MPKYVPNAASAKQAAKTMRLSREMASTWRQRRAPQVRQFIGTLYTETQF